MSLLLPPIIAGERGDLFSYSSSYGILPEAKEEIMAFLVNLNAPLKPTRPLLPLLPLSLLLLLSLRWSLHLPPATTLLDIATAELRRPDTSLTIYYFHILHNSDAFVKLPLLIQFSYLQVSDDES